MVYKTLKKVSDVCQLLDKSKYTATQTKKGITFTNNGDGTITANGTAVGGYSVFPVQNLITVIAGHKYLISTGHTSQLGIQLYTKGNKVFAPHDIYNVPQIITCIVTYNQVQYEIVFNNGVTVSGAILKPQLFDLTEMYGAGNEPTTVEQFRQDFPDELYDYKPYCFVKSYKNCLTCTTKNLFDIPLTQGYPSNTTLENTALRTFTIGTYIVGISRNNYYASYYISNFAVDKNKIKFKPSSSGFGISIPLLLTVGKTYTVSCKADNNFYPSIGISYYKEDGTLISYTESQKITNNPVKSFTVPENTYYTLILFYGRAENEYTFSNIQLEEGSTASEYQPYGYIQSRKKSLKVSNSILL